jgi:phosphatidylinositol alpha-1,6-mannosyltransferase
VILISTQCFPPAIGGIESLIHNLASQLHNRGYEISVFADKTKQNDSSFDLKQPLNIQRFSGPKPIRRRCKARAIASTIKQKKCDALITDSWKSLEHIRIPKNIKVFCLAHGTELPRHPSPRKRRRIKKSLLKSSTIISNSKYTTSQLTPFIGGERPITVIHPAINRPSRPKDNDMQNVRASISGRSPVLISVGRLESRKGFDTVINILPELIKEYPDLLYVLIGDGSLREKMSEVVQQSSLEHNVLFAGYLDEGILNAWIASSDLFLLPARQVKDDVEGFGIAYIEAAWFGLPAIAGNSGGASEAVIDCETGLVCNGESQASVLEGIRKLLGDTALRSQMGKKAQDRARSLLWENVIEDYVKLIEENQIDQ